MLTWMALFCACAGPQQSRPAPSTSTLVDEAQDAERERRYDDAQRLYEQAKAEAPDAASRAVAARALARAFIAWGELDRAMSELEEATRLEPQDAGAWHDLGMVRHHTGDVDGAERAFRASIAARPDDGRSRIALAALLWKQSRHGEALREYEALRALPLPARVRDQVEWAIRTLRQRMGEPP